MRTLRAVDAFLVRGLFAAAVQRRLRPVRCRSPCLSTMPASSAVMGSGPRREYYTTPPDCIELSGYRDQTGRFVQVDPPLRTPLADVSTDGTLDAAQLAQMVAAVSPERTMQ